VTNQTVIDHEVIKQRQSHLLKQATLETDRCVTI